jgi:hypothetical protein
MTNNKISDCSACGTSSNALLKIIPELYGDFKIEYIPSNDLQFVQSLIMLDESNSPSIYRLCILPALVFGPNEYQTNWFQGHAFIIWKYNKNKYFLIQSYCEKYKFTENIKFMDKKAIMQVFEKVSYICSRKLIDKKFVEYWEELTNISMNDLKNHESELNYGFNCYYKSIN